MPSPFAAAGAGTAAAELVLEDCRVPEANRLQHADSFKDTAATANIIVVNAILTLSGGLPEGFIVMDFLTSNFAWFLTTNIDGLIFMNRIPFEMDMSVEFTTDNLLVKGYQRYVPSYYDWRHIYGTYPTS